MIFNKTCTYNLVEYLELILFSPLHLFIIILLKEKENFLNPTGIAILSTVIKLIFITVDIWAALRINSTILRVRR